MATGTMHSQSPAVWTPEPEIVETGVHPSGHHDVRGAGGMYTARMTAAGLPRDPYPEVEDEVLTRIGDYMDDDDVIPALPPDERQATVPANPPRTLAEMVSQLGERGRERTCAGGVIVLPEPCGAVTEVRVHVRLAPLFRRFLEEIARQGHWPLVKTVHGYSLKKRRGSGSGRESDVSLTAWGAAIEINAGYNLHGVRMPHGPTGEPHELVSKGKPGFRFCADHPIVEIARDCGLTWAGMDRWAIRGEPTNIRPDGAVFQWPRSW